MATYVNDLRLKEIGTGESSGTWGTETNVNLELIGEALGFGTEAITTNADTHTTTVADGSTDPGRAMYIKYTGTLDSACTITIGPNTMSRLHYIENGTSGSQNIIISQGSGANITIPAGDTKAVYLDGAGSGAAVVDVFASFSAVDLKVQDDLTVTDDATIGGTLGVTGILTCTDDIIIGDGKTIGSASDVDAMTIASNGQVTFTQTLIGTALDISGDIDVDGTANLDIVDIDGATNIAAAVTMATTNKIQFRDDAIHISSTADGQLDLVADTEIQIAATTIDVNGNLDVSGTTVSAGKITADAGIDIDNFNIDGTTIALSSGDLTLDVAGDIILDADGGDINLKDGGTVFGVFSSTNSDLNISTTASDEDIVFKGSDGGSTITALTLDMSDSGTANFGGAVVLGGSLIKTGDMTLDASGDIILDADGGDVILKDGGTNFAILSKSSANLDIYNSGNDGSVVFKGEDGGTGITALTLDMSAAGAATFNGNVKAPRFILNGTDSATTRYIFTDNTNTGDGRLLIQSGGGSAGYGGAINLYSHAHASKPGDVVAGLSTGSGGAFRVNTSGIDGGSDIIRVDADGLKFGSDTAAANALDDYEEGSWTPVSKSDSTTIGTTVNFAKYVKIGSWVYVTAFVSRADATSLSGNFTLEGLPYQPAAGSAQVNGAFWFDTTGTDTVTTIYFVAGTNYVQAKLVGSSGDYATADLFQQGRPFYMSGSYMVAF